jgi:hypothetical protein
MARSRLEHRVWKWLACGATLLLFIPYQMGQWTYPLIPLHVVVAVLTACFLANDTHGRARHWLTRAALIGSFLFLVLWVLSSVRFAFRVGSSSFLALARGEIELTWYHGPNSQVGKIMSSFTNWPSGWSLGPPMPSTNAAWQCFLISLRLPTYHRGEMYSGTTSLGVTSVHVDVPFWLPFLLCAIPALYVFWKDARRPLPGHCTACGYNLTGNVSGVCPECGTSVAVNE